MVSMPLVANAMVRVPVESRLVMCTESRLTSATTCLSRWFDGSLGVRMSISR